MRILIKAVLALTILTIYLPHTVYSQTYSQNQKIEVHLIGGVSFPSQPDQFTDYWNFGYNIGGGFGYRFSRTFSSSVLLNYNNFPFNEGKLLRELGIEGMGIEVDGGSSIIITLSGSVKARFIDDPNSFSPYLVGGMGYFKLATSDVKLTYGYQSETIKSESESAFNILFGGGIEVPIGMNKYFFFELNYGLGFTNENYTGYIPVKLGFIILLDN